MPLEEIKHYMDLCKEGSGTLQERLEIIVQQKQWAQEQMAALQAKIDHLDWKEQHYRMLIETGAEDDCNPIHHA